MKWEYKIITEQKYNLIIQNRLNELGKEGWELANTLPELAHLYVFILKRKIK